MRRLFAIFMLLLAIASSLALGRLVSGNVGALTMACASDSASGEIRGVEVPAVLRHHGTDPVVGTGLSQSTTSSIGPRWRPSERYEDKYVPIISLADGTRLGVARVNGPRSRVAFTDAVIRFSIKFMDVMDIDVYVPVSTRRPSERLIRVQGVGVTGLGDIKL